MNFELNGEKLNYYKLIHCYMKKEGIDFSETEKYASMGIEKIKKLINEKYDIKTYDWQHLEKAKKMTEIKSEYEEQKNLVRWLRENKIPCQSSGNGFSLDTANNIHYIAKLKASGMSLGYPDLDVFIGQGISLHIEMKRTKGGVVSDKQEKWINWLNNNGYKAKVCYGFADAQKYVVNECNKIGKILN